MSCPSLDRSGRFHQGLAGARQAIRRSACALISAFVTGQNLPVGLQCQHSHCSRRRRARHKAGVNLAPRRQADEVFSSWKFRHPELASHNDLAIGLFTGRMDAYGLRADARQLAREMHDRFRQRHGSACCRVLTRNVRSDPTAHRRHCAALTGWAAETAAHLLMERFAELPMEGDNDYLNRRESRLGGLLRRWGRKILG